MSAKQDIINLFHDNVKGKKADVSRANARHDGRRGHWLESQFGINHNADNEPDLFGYELKNQTTSKTTFGDWSANEYIFDNPTYFSVFSGDTSLARREIFLTIFGKPNMKKHGRYSWSGEPCPKISGFNTFGQRLVIGENNNIIAEYCYSKDQRSNKENVVPDLLKQEHLILALWYGNSVPEGKKGKCLKCKVEDKFNDKGWFTCKMDPTGTYDKICFGEPMTFEKWISLIKDGTVFFDSGMYQGNPRPYSQWRANNDYWDSLIVDVED